MLHWHCEYSDYVGDLSYIIEYRTCKSSGYPEGLGARFDYKLALTQSYRYRKSLVTNMLACKKCCVHASQSKPTMNRILILKKWYEQYSFVLFKDYSSFYKLALITKLEISYIKKLLLYKITPYSAKVKVVAEKCSFKALPLFESCIIVLFTFNRSSIRLCHWKDNWDSDVLISLINHVSPFWELITYIRILDEERN